MKKMSLNDHVLVGHFLKVAHIASLKALTRLGNRDGKTKPPYIRLKKLNYELLQFRSDLDDILYNDFRSDDDNHKIRQCYFGPLDRKLFKSGAKTFFFKSASTQNPPDRVHRRDLKKG